MTFTLSHIKVRPLRFEDIPLISNYWLHSDDEHLKNMGVDLSKLPSQQEIHFMLNNQIDTPITDRKSFALICCNNEVAIGHCNILDIEKGVSANMHLHIWNKINRQKGVGSEMVKLSVIQFFNLFDLQRIISEPYSQNPAPHKVLLKTGFTREKEYITTPGSLSFRQSVIRYVLTKEQFESSLY